MHASVNLSTGIASAEAHTVPAQQLEKTVVTCNTREHAAWRTFIAAESPGKAAGFAIPSSTFRAFLRRLHSHAQPAAQRHIGVSTCVGIADGAPNCMLTTYEGQMRHVNGKACACTALMPGAGQAFISRQVATP
jgi:hypothetical protein